MGHGRRLTAASCVGGVIGLVAAGIALAAAPLPKAGGQYYGTAHNPKSFLVLVISKTDHKKIVSGPDIHTSGPQGSNVDPACPKGQAQAGFNGTTLTLASGHYGFSDKWTSHAQIIESTSHGRSSFRSRST